MSTKVEIHNFWVMRGEADVVDAGMRRHDAGIPDSF
jgi:hypothetical protein